MKSPRFFALAALCAAVLLSPLAAAFPAQAATAGVTVDMTARLQGSYRGSNDLGTPVFPFDFKKLLQLQPGTGTGYADKLFCDERTIAASSTENLDLAGSLTDPLGSTLTFAKVKAIMVVAAAGNTNDVVVGGAGTNTFTGPFADATDKIKIKPGSSWLITDAGSGWTVTAATGDILLVGNSSSGTGVTYSICVIGTSS